MKYNNCIFVSFLINNNVYFFKLDGVNSASSGSSEGTSQGNSDGEVSVSSPKENSQTGGSGDSSSEGRL